MGAFLALALNGFREARRNRVTVVVLAFAVVLLLSSSLVADVSVATLDRVLVDVSLGAMSLLLVLLAIFLSCGLLSREIERRTIFMMMSRPISRALFLVARLGGNMLTLGVLLLIMAAAFLVAMLLYRTPLHATQALAVGMLWVELLVLSSIGFLMSTFSSQLVSGAVTLGVYFAGHLSADLYRLAQRTSSEGLKLLAKGAYYALPNLERLNYRPHATYGLEVPTSEVLQSLVYALAYAGAAVLLAVLVFARRDFK